MRDKTPESSLFAAASPFLPPPSFFHVSAVKWRVGGLLHGKTLSARQCSNRCSVVMEHLLKVLNPHEDKFKSRALYRL